MLTEEHRSLQQAVWSCPFIESVIQLAVALKLVEHWPIMTPGVNEIARACKVSPRAVRNALDDLEDCNVIRRTERTGASNKYDFIGWNGQRVSIPTLGSPRTGPPRRRSSNPPPAEGGATEAEGAAPGAGGGGAAPAAAGGAPGAGGGAAPGAGQGLHLVQPKILDPDPLDPFMDKDRSGSLRAGARDAAPPSTPPPASTAPADALIDMRSWTLPDAWVGEWNAKGFRLERLERVWARYVARFGNRPRRLSYIRSAFLGWCRWEADDAAASVAPGNAQRGADLPPPSSVQEKDGGLDVPEPTRVFGAKNGVDVGRMAAAFVRSGEAARHGVRASEIFTAKVKAAVAAKQRATLPMSKLRELDAKRAAAGAAA